MTKSSNTDTFTAVAATKDAIPTTVTPATTDDNNDHDDMILKEQRKEIRDNNNNNNNEDQIDADEKEMQKKIEMKEISSIGFFKATPLKDFRRKWKECLKRNIIFLTTTSSSSSTTTIIRYDRFEIIRILSKNIDWKSLCENHDKDKQRRRQQQQQEKRGCTTALGEIVTAMINPTVIPHCCRVKCLMEVLLNAILVSPSSSSSSSSSSSIKSLVPQQQQQNTTTRWTPSQQFLLETIREMLWGSPSSLSSSSSSSSSSFIMINCIRDFVVSITKLPTTLSTSASTTTTATVTAKKTTTMTTTMAPTEITPNRINRLLSSIYWLLSSSMSSLSLLEMESLVSSGLMLLQRIDQKSIPSSQGRTNDDDDDDSSSRRYCLVCSGSGNGIGHARNKKMRVADLSDLHDEELASENSNIARYNSNNKMQYFWRRGNEVKNVSLKDVLSMKGKRKSNSNNTNAEHECQCTTTTTTTNNSNRDRENLKRKRATDSTTKISADWSKVRSRAYKKFISFVVEQQQQTRQQKRLRELSLNNNRITSMSTTETKATMTTTRMEYESNLNSNDDETWMWWLLRDVAAHPESPTRRVCLALLAHSLGGPKCPYYYQKIAKLCWRGYLENLPPESKSSSISSSPESSCGWLRLYSEWLSECSVFDQREQAWEAFQPILQHVVATATSSTASEPHNEDTEVHSQTYDDDDDDANQMGSKEINPSLLACLGYILHRRSHLFEHCRTDDETCNNSNNPKAIMKKFRSFVDILSIHCGESSEPWLRLFSDSGSIRDGVESTLQRLGVLSFSVLDSRKKSNHASTMSNYNVYQAHTSTKSDKYLYFLATSNWPYASQFNMRNAMSRIDRSVMSLENGNDTVISLLTSPTSGYKTTKYKKSKKNKITNKSLSSVLMMDYLYDNGILCLIFSFCGPKRLSKIPQVCKVWKEIVDTVSNTLWQKAYVTQFGAYQWPCSIAENRYIVATTTAATANDNISHKIESISKTFWKNRFDRKQIIERIVQFQRNPRTGYKHQTCCYLDCLEIFKTANQEHKHYQMHLRRLTKQRATLLEKKKTKKKKAKGGKVITTKKR
ncbi:MAG: hypothetical protein ACI8RD_007409 [Bacillariaceae sp.]|jgi:hypothetical protein